MKINYFDDQAREYVVTEPFTPIPWLNYLSNDNFTSTTITRPERKNGEGDMSWFSGTVAWMYLAGTQYILGVRPVPAGLLIDPNVSGDWTAFKVARLFRGTCYQISFRGKRGHTSRVAAISVDGEGIEGNVIAPVTDRKSVRVDVTLE